MNSGDENMKRFFAKIVALATVLSMWTVSPVAAAAPKADLISKKFDLGGQGTASGYTGVSASDQYSEAKGYGFASTQAVENVSASGTGAFVAGHQRLYR